MDQVGNNICINNMGNLADTLVSTIAETQGTAVKTVRTGSGEANTHLSICPEFAVLSALIRVSAAAASSNAQLTEDVNLRSTSGSAKAFPSAVDNLPIPFVPRSTNQWISSFCMGNKRTKAI